MKTRGILFGLCGFLAVCLGAFGAHGLKTQLTIRGMELWQTGFEYHMVHTLVLGILLALDDRLVHRWSQWSFGLLTAGILVFSGSLYCLAISGLSWIGMVTPIGGLLLLAGWLCVIPGFVGRSTQRSP